MFRILVRDPARFPGAAVIGGGTLNQRAVGEGGEIDIRRRLTLRHDRRRERGQRGAHDGDTCAPEFHELRITEVAPSPSRVPVAPLSYCTPPTARYRPIIAVNTSDSAWAALSSAWSAVRSASSSARKSATPSR